MRQQAYNTDAFRLIVGSSMLAMGGDMDDFSDQPRCHRLETAVRYTPVEDCPTKAAMVEEIRQELLARRTS